MLGMGPDGQIFKSIMERAKEEGYQTGLVVTVYLQHATPALSSHTCPAAAIWT